MQLVLLQAEKLSAWGGEKKNWVQEIYEATIYS